MKKFSEGALNHARAIILDRAKDVDDLSISEVLEDLELAETDHNALCKEVAEAIAAARVTVEWDAYEEVETA